MDELQKTERELNNSKSQLDAEMQRRSVEIRSAEGSRARIKGDIDKIEFDLRELSRSGNSGMVNMLHPRMTEILRQLQQEKLSGQVFGPLGACVKLKDGNVFVYHMFMLSSVIKISDPSIYRLLETRCSQSLKNALLRLRNASVSLRMLSLSRMVTTNGK
jgi:hypothetical protein